MQVCLGDFYQLFTLHAMMKNATIPLVYGLLIGKSNEDYNVFFKKLLEQDNFEPESIMTDFETGTIKSVRDMLPNVLHKGTFLSKKKSNLIFFSRLSLSFFTSGMATSSKQGIGNQI